MYFDMNNMNTRTNKEKKNANCKKLKLFLSADPSPFYKVTYVTSKNAP